MSEVRTSGAAARIVSRIAWNFSPPTQNAEMYSAAVGILNSRFGDAHSFSTAAAASTTGVTSVSIGVSFSVTC
jgi:hypothetical protein